MTTIEMKQTAAARVQECKEICEKYYGESFPDVRTTFEVTGQCGGLAYYGENRVDLNLILLRENFDEFINQVIPHEVAHLCEIWVYGNHEFDRAGRRRGHGPRWQAIMRRVFGLKPDRCHSMDTSRASTKKQRRWSYIAPKCGCEYELSTTLHNRIRKGQRRVCSKHRNPIMPKAEYLRRKQTIARAANDSQRQELPKGFRYLD